MGRTFTCLGVGTSTATISFDVNGHAAIMSKRVNDPLASWINTQRKNYRKYLEGQHTTMTEERVKHLNSIGFDWYALDTRAQCKLKGFDKLP